VPLDPPDLPDVAGSDNGGGFGHRHVQDLIGIMIEQIHQPLDRTVFGHRKFPVVNQSYG
jgi:hypothetical protein